MTNIEHLGLVPDPDFCVVLKEHNFPQTTRFFWVTSGILTAKQEEVWVLATADDLEIHGLKPGDRECFAAPVVEEFMKVTPPSHYVMHTRFGYIFVDLTRTKFSENTLDKTKNVSIAFFRIKEVDDARAVNCFAKGICYLLMKKEMAFKAPEAQIV